MGRNKKPQKFQLHQAAACGDVREVKRLVKKRLCDVNEEDVCPNRHTPLSYAARYNHIEVAEILVNHKADVNRGRFYPPLHVAVGNGHKVMAKWLLENGADPNKSDKCGLTCLYYTVQSNNIGLAEILVNYDADVNKGVLLPLHAAVDEGHVRMVKWLLEHGAESNKTSKNRYWGFTALHHATVNGDSETVELLLAHGADPNIKDENPFKNNDTQTELVMARDVNYLHNDSGKQKLKTTIGDGMEEYFKINYSKKPSGTVSVSFEVTLAQDNTNTKVENLQISANGVLSRSDTCQVMSKLETIHEDIQNMAANMNTLSVNDDRLRNKYKNDDKHERVRTNLVYLSKHLHNINFLCSHLIQDDVITISDEEAIMGEQSDRMRASKLLKYLLKKDGRAMDVFYKALKQEGQAHLAAIIQE